MFTARTALRSLAFRRSIHSGRSTRSTRSFYSASGAALVVGGAAYLAYQSWNIDGRNRPIALDEDSSRKPSSSKSARKNRKTTDDTSVDAPAPTKPVPTEPGVLKPSGEAPNSTPAVGSTRPSEDENRASDPAPTTGSSPPDKEEDEEDRDRAANQGAYNPDTGEINWDCPCLGGMAHGPCGPQFREAFSCFVYSNEEPKGVDCVEKFKDMQDCFRAHPDVYGEEIDDDDDEATEKEEEREVSVSQGDDESTPAQKPESPEDRKDTPPGVPSPPSAAPPSRQNAPTANVSPETTPTKRGRSY